MKKIGFLAMSLMAISAIGLAGCDSKDENKNNDNIIDNGNNDNGNNNDGENNGGNDNTEEAPLSPTTIWVVGDSTVCDYGKYDANGNKTGITDSSYFYDRYGYGTQLSNYFNDLVTVKNIALSGRSSLSFTKEANYKTLTDGIKEGDYLVVGFGHNDEKSDDKDRFASANDPTTKQGSFKYNLYEYYCKVAIEKGATPILCSPIVRATSTNDYSGSNGHITADGNYGQAVIELGTEKNIQTVDLTTLTKDLYTRLGYEEAQYFHAMTGGIDDNTPSLESIDKTHINIYGAKMVSYLFANSIKESNCKLNKYLNESLAEPKRDTDLVKNAGYKYVAYNAPNLEEWKSTIIAGQKQEDGTYNTEYYNYLKTQSDGWYGTVFGDIGGSGMSNGNGWQAKETEAGVFTVGCEKNKGKIGSSEGYAMVFKQIGKDDNFTLTADVLVKAAGADSASQGGFGIMLRDDIYVNQTAKNGSIKSTAVYAGMYTSSKVNETNIVYSRESTNLTAAAGKLENQVYAEGDTAKLTIERVGQVVKVKVEYKDATYEKAYTDLVFNAIDTEYMYVGMYACRSTICEFTNVVYTKTGVSQGA